MLADTYFQSISPVTCAHDGYIYLFALNVFFAKNFAMISADLTSKLIKTESRTSWRSIRDRALHKTDHMKPAQSIDASVDFFEDSGKILIAANGMMDKSIAGKKYKYIFRNTFGESEMGASMADHAARAGADRIAIYHSDTEYENNMGMAFSKRALENGLKVLDDVSEIGSQKDFDNIFKRWEAIGVNCVMISQESIADAFSLAERIRKKSDNIKIYGDFSFDAEEMLMEYKEYVEGIIIPTLVPINQSEELDNFNARYEEIYGSVPTWWAAHTYDTVRMVLDTAVQAGSNSPEKIAEGLHSESGYQGITGKIMFDENGLLTNVNPVYSIVEDGRLVNLNE